MCVKIVLFGKIVCVNCVVAGCFYRTRIRIKVC